MINIQFSNITDDTRYAFAVAKIRALESKMLNHSQMIRILKSSGTDEMLKILMDTEYSICLNEAGDAHFEAALDHELKRIYKLIHSIDPDPLLTDIWRWRYDAHNIKIILKARPTNIEEVREHLIFHGTLEPKVVFQAINQNDFKIFPPPIKRALKKIRSGEEEGEKIDREIDFVIDIALYRYLHQVAEQSKNVFILYIVKMLIDFINLENFLRMSQIKDSKDILSSSFISGGMIKKEDLLAIQETEKEESIRTFIDKKTPYEGLLSFTYSKNLALFETALENLLIEYLKQTRQRVFGVEPLVAYMLAKELEVKNLRLLYIAKANGIEEGLIKERLRETYV